MLLAASANADPGGDALVRAKTAVDSSDYLAARTALAEALAAGTNGPDQLAEIYRLTGVVTGALGDAKASQDAFTKCLLLAPGTALPVGTSPKIARPFDAAKAFTKSRQPVRIKTETTAEPKPTVAISVTSDPLAMIARFRVFAVVDGKPEQKLDRVASERSVIELPVGARIDLRVAALDDKGNRLVELGTADVPIVIVGKPAVIVKAPDQPTAKVQPVVVVTKQQPAKQRPLLLRWWLWGGAAIVVGGAGAYFGVDALVKKGELQDLQDTSSNHSFDEALAKEDATRRSLLFANIGLIAGGTLAVGATVLYLTRPRATRERAVAVTPVVGEHGGGFVLGGRF
jgi:hypothetical protein